MYFHLGGTVLREEGVVHARLPTSLGAVRRFPVRTLLHVLERPLDAVKASQRQLRGLVVDPVWRG